MSVSLKQLEHSAGNIPIEEAFVQKKVEMDHLLSDKSFGFIKVLIIGFLVWGLECFAQGKPLARIFHKKTCTTAGKALTCFRARK